MPRRRRTVRARAGPLGEPAHVARIFVGGIKSGGRAKVGEAELERLVDMVSATGAGAATVLTGRSKWRSPETGTVYEEPSTIIEVVASARDACPRVHRRMRGIAARAAAIADQESVLAVTHCQGGDIEADVVTRSGRRQAALPLIRQSQAGLQGHRRAKRRKGRS